MFATSGDTRSVIIQNLPYFCGFTARYTKASLTVITQATSQILHLHNWYNGGLTICACVLFKMSESRAGALVSGSEMKCGSSICNNEATRFFCGKIFRKGVACRCGECAKKYKQLPNSAIKEITREEYMVAEVIYS